MTQLQRDNVELQRQVHEHSDTVLALRRDLAAANARLSDVTGRPIFLPHDARSAKCGIVTLMWNACQFRLGTMVNVICAG